eukprot:3133086-Rhodomonas_salina.1
MLRPWVSTRIMRMSARTSRRAIRMGSSTEGGSAIALWRPPTKSVLSSECRMSGCSASPGTLPSSSISKSGHSQTRSASGNASWICWTAARGRREARSRERGTSARHLSMSVAESILIAPSVEISETCVTISASRCMQQLSIEISTCATPHTGHTGDTGTTHGHTGDTDHTKTTHRPRTTSTTHTTSACNSEREDSKKSKRAGAYVLGGSRALAKQELLELVAVVAEDHEARGRDAAHGVERELAELRAVLERVDARVGEAVRLREQQLAEVREALGDDAEDRVREQRRPGQRQARQLRQLRHRRRQ